jgi:surface polysaccharide O-acyltransferase-like enzyme
VGGAYLVHIFPVVTLQTVLLALALAPLGKFALVTLLAVPLSFLIVAALRRLPGVARAL